MKPLKLRATWLLSSLFFFVSLMSLPAYSATIGWTDWEMDKMVYGDSGSASGMMLLPDGETILVSYTGENRNYGDKGNWSQIPATYTLPGVVDNYPTPINESIQLVGGNQIVNTLRFSAPVLNPVMAVQSVGNGGDVAKYYFDVPFTILAQGPGHWGGGNASLSQAGNTLIGYEGNGIIQFEGIFSALSWTVPDGEHYHMFTVGVPGAGGENPVPEPASMLLLGAGLAGLAGFRKRNRK